VPKAFGQKFHYLDHDSDYVAQIPPVQNVWYEVFHAYDVRLIWCTVFQLNDETAAKNIEVRWTIDGNVYVAPFSLAHNTYEWIFRTFERSLDAPPGLYHSAIRYNAAYFVDKRGQDFKVEIRITSALGTNQALYCWCVRETLELT